MRTVATLRVDPAHLAFAPQYPLWTDGAAKRRWISLPPGTAIDASDPDAWVFPAGTRLWKEFSFAGRASRRATSSGKPTGSGSTPPMCGARMAAKRTLAPERGKRNAFALGGGRAHTIPGVSDCKACHQGGRSEVLGFSALQLSPERDPERAARGDAVRRRSARPDRARPAGRTSGVPRATSNHSRVRHRACRTRLSAWQLRALPQRTRPAEQCRPVPAPALDASSQAVATTWATR